MRNVLACLALGLALSATPALAQERKLGAPVETLDKTPQQRVDELFAKLKKSGSEMAAGQVAGSIGERWNDSGSASVDLMMGWAKKAMDEQKFDVALDFLDQVTVLRPNYAEGFNRRATAHALMGNTAKAVADIERTLELEPRHFGALAGLAGIMRAQGFKESALALYQRILDVYPMMRAAQGELARLSEELEPRPI